MFIPISSINNIYLINNHIRDLSSQYLNPLDELLISTIVHQIRWSTHKVTVTIKKVRAHIGISINKTTNYLANNLHKPTPTPHIHIALKDPILTKGVPTGAH
jgi:hypothetical protein